MASNLGFIPLSPNEILLNTQNIFINTFGNTVNLNPVGNTGLFIQELADLNIEINTIQTVLYNGLYNPNIASGIYLDSICALLGIKRIPAIASFATCSVTGLVGTIIPVGSQILNTNGDLFELIDNNIVITGNPTIDVGVFSALKVGEPIPVSANTLNVIVQRTPGWDTVNNPTDGVLGKPAQSDTSLRYTRKQALATNAINTIDALIAGAQSLIPIFITDFIVLQNNTASPQTINGVSVPANSIFLSVVQVNDDSGITEMLYKNKPPGIQMGGNYTSNVWYNPVYPWVQFSGKWQKAEVQQVIIAVNIVDVNYPYGTAAAIKNAILDAFNNGTLTNPPITMRSGTIYASQFISVITELGVTTVSSITITTTTLNSPAATLTLTAAEAPALQLENIIVTGVS